MPRLELEIHRQPDATTCGPTCLHAVYRYLGDPITLDDVVAETVALRDGGTLSVLLACHALARGYRATLYSFNLSLFDPTWFELDRDRLMERLRVQAGEKSDPRLEVATAAYLDFVAAGGELRFMDLSPDLLGTLLERQLPVLAGLSSTWLYREVREVAATNEEDDLRGTPAGHFVVLCGYDAAERQVRIADPLHPDPRAVAGHHWQVDVHRLVTAVLLGVLTYDGNLLQIDREAAP